MVCFLSNFVDRLDRTNSAGSDLDKNQVTSSRNFHVPDHGDAGSSNILNENHYSRFIALEGCSSGAASQLLNDRECALPFVCYNLSILGYCSSLGFLISYNKYLIHDKYYQLRLRYEDFRT